MIQKVKNLKKQHLRHLDDELTRIKSMLIELGAQKIILFGSAARNELGLTSDIDLIAIIDSNKSFIERLEDIYLKMQPKDVDLLVYTPDEFNRMSKDNFFIRHAIKEGKVIYERTK